MRTIILLAILASLILLAGCGPNHSLYPIYTDDSIVFEPGLIGTWEDDDTVYSFEPYSGGQYSDYNKYRITATDDEGTISQCIGTLCRIGENLWLDLEWNYDDELSSPKGIMTAVTIIPVHGICRMDSVEPTLKFANLDENWLRTYVEENPDSISHEWCGEDLDYVVLTASTEELQKFLLEIEDIPDALGKMIELDPVVIDDSGNRITF